MKCISILVFLLYTVNSFSQINDFEGTWISEDMECILICDEIKGDICSAISNKMNSTLYMDPVLIADTLRFDNVYDFKVIEHSRTLLLLKPVSELSIEFFENEDVIIFKSQQSMSDSSYEFYELIYHGCLCCEFQDFYLRITKDQQVIFIGDSILNELSYCNSEKDIIGSFKGEMSNEDYNQLIALLSSTPLDKYRYPIPFIEGGCFNELNVQGEKQNINHNMRWHPLYWFELLEFLNSLYKRIELSPTKNYEKLEMNK